MAFAITPDHGYVILSTAAVCFYGIFAGGAYVGGSRSAVFGAKWRESPAVKALAETHKKEVGDELPKGGYPDMVRTRTLRGFRASLQVSGQLSSHTPLQRTRAMAALRLR